MFTIPLFLIHNPCKNKPDYRGILSEDLINIPIFNAPSDDPCDTFRGNKIRMTYTYDGDKVRSVEFSNIYLTRVNDFVAVLNSSERQVKLQKNTGDTHVYNSIWNQQLLNKGQNGV